MSKQQTAYEDVEYYSPEESLHGKSALYIVAYFLFLAIMIVPAMRMHLGMPGIVFSMLGAGVLLALLVLVFKLAKRKIVATGLKPREIVRIAVGYNPYQGEEEDGQAV